ncbi:CvpA family protein, partial [Mesonia mobilis]
MNLVDVVIVIILILGFVRGAMRGLIVELASLVALIAGIYGAIHFS